MTELVRLQNRAHELLKAGKINKDYKDLRNKIEKRLDFWGWQKDTELKT